MGKLKAEILADIPKRKFDWLWKGYVPKKFLTLVEGDSTAGKSWLVYDIAARLSIGSPFATKTPEAGVYQPQKTLYFTGEDPPEMIQDRFDMLGGDPTKFILSSEVFCMSDKGARKEAEDLIKAHDIRLVVFDPLIAYFDEHTNPNNQNSVRKALTPFTTMAAALDTAVIAIRHWGKSDIYDSALKKGIGSVDFGACCRSMLAVAKTGSGKQRVVSQVKCNIMENLSPSLLFNLENSQMTWGGESEFGVDDRIREERKGKMEEGKIKTREALRAKGGF